ncbi:MAG: peroxiredoxin, partial [Candidatus Paceibacteria bacterium]
EAAGELNVALIDQPAPDFTLATAQGTNVRLSDYRGKIVVLEWFNPDCPFTRYSHRSGLLGSYPAELREQGVVWLGIQSGSGEELAGSLPQTQDLIAEWGIDFPILLDREGKVGRRFDATKTPEVFLIDADGVLRYVGAPDNMPFGKVRGGGEGQNYLARAIAQLRTGETVTPNCLQAYGCRVRYTQPHRLD